MKYCGSCRKENAADAAFCRYCGQPIQQDAAAQDWSAQPAGQPYQVPPVMPPQSAPRKTPRKRSITPVIAAAAVLAVSGGLVWFLFTHGLPGVTGIKPGNTVQSVQSGESGQNQGSSATAGDIWKLTDEQKAEMAEIEEMPDLDPEDYIEKEPAEPLSAHGYDWLYPEEEDWEDPEEAEEAGSSSDSSSEKASVDEVPQDPLTEHPSPAFSVSPVKGITISGEEGALDHERTFKFQILLH